VSTTIGITFLYRRPQDIKLIDNLITQVAQFHQKINVIVISADEISRRIVGDLIPNSTNFLILKSFPLGRQRKVAVEMCTTEFITFFDHDMAFSQDYFEKVLPFFDAHEVAAVGVRKMPLNYSRWSKLEWIVNDHYSFRTGFFGCGGTTYRVGAVRDVGNFDENLGAGEDSDLQRRLRKKRYKSVYLTDVVVGHNYVDSWKEFFYKQFQGGKRSFKVRNSYQDLLRALLSPIRGLQLAIKYDEPLLVPYYTLRTCLICLGSIIGER